MRMRVRFGLLALGTVLATFGLAAPASAAPSINYVKLHQNPNFCWDDPIGRGPGARDLILWQCVGIANQRWQVLFTPRGNLPGTFRFQNVSSQRCIDAVEGGGAIQSSIRVSPCNFASAAQEFVVDYAFNDGHWHQAWRNEVTGMCMDLFGGIANGRPIVNWPCNRTAAQLWRFVNA